MARDELPDPFGETQLVASLPPSRPIATYACIALFVAMAAVLLALRGVVG